MSRGRWAVQRDRLNLHRTPPEPLHEHTMDEEVTGLLNSLGMQQQARTEKLMAGWSEIVGPQLARHTRPGPVRNGTLMVFVTNSAMLSHLSRFGISKIRERVQDLCGADQVRNVRLALDPDIPGRG